MLSDFYIPRLSNDMKIAVQKNNLGGQIWYRNLDPVKKTASMSEKCNPLSRLTKRELFCFILPAC